ncbi:FORMATE DEHYDROGENASE 1 [Salix koriyanagi]|uniref:FORMATE DEHYDROGENASE 1 n=1 Tax=Salix koriyanagi TaxID=2511006 RepID=A0A9Q1AJ02_9ROSI|nr:FORMATE DEHYDROGENASE 1 [Salix koriyanagi]
MPQLTGAVRAIGVELVPFDQAISTADFISLHMPLTPATEKVFSDDTFEKMKKGARIVNVARGGVIDEDALLRALDSGKVAQAALDVFAEEPQPKDSKLVQHERVTVTPHRSWSQHEGSTGRRSYRDSRGCRRSLEGGTRCDCCERPHGSSRDFTAKKKGLRISEERVAVDAPPGLPVLSIQVRLSNVDSKFGSAVSGGDISIEGGVKHGVPHLTRVGSFSVDASLGGNLVLCRQVDQPGMIGQVGNIPGEQNVNVSFMSVGRTAGRRNAIMAIGVDEEPSLESLEKIGQVPSIEEFVFLKL